MKAIKLISLLFLSFVFSFSVSASDFKVDLAHTSVGFQVKHLVIATVTGKFEKFTAEVDFDEKSQTLKKVTAVVNVNSINTGIEARDNHLRSPDFFNAEKYPEIVFESTKISKQDKMYEVFGKLTIRGVTKDILLKGKLNGVVSDPSFGTRAAFSGEAVINRQDFDVKWNKKMEMGGMVVSDEVTIKVEVELVKK